MSRWGILRDMYTELFNPIYATKESLPVIIVGVSTQGATPQALIVEDDGRLSFVTLTDLVADVRFRDGVWHDVSPDVAESGGMGEEA